jgi:DNA helicase HerA-like ATPase
MQQIATSGMPASRQPRLQDRSIGRIVSVTGSKAIVLLDSAAEANNLPGGRPEMGTLLAIEQTNTVVLAIVSALSVPVPAQRDGESEIWIAELGLVGELWLAKEGRLGSFNRGVTVYPALGDRVRVALKPELELAFCGDGRSSVRVGCIRQDASIPAVVKVNDLLGKHFAILGTTGTGKSCTTALILRSILSANPAAHIVLLDPHNEYATAFPEWGEVISPRNMQLPFWLLTFEELIEVLITDPGSRRGEVEILQELIPLCKSKYAQGTAGRKDAVVRRGVVDTGRFTVDTPVPYRISDLTAAIDERMGKLENKKDLTPYRQLRSRIDAISQDARYGFMFGSLTVYDGMAQILGRIFRVPVNNKPITILELTGIPSEIVNVVVSVLCRMTFDFALWSEGKVPVTLVCEEAHRYVPANSQMGFEPAKRAIAKIAKEGRKYGSSLCIVTQRPAEIDPTILSQCNTVFALRMSNDRDQAIVASAVSDTGSGLLEFLPALGQREAIAFGDGVALPVRIKFDELSKECLPRSSTARFSEAWQASVGDENFLEQIVERWRNAGLGSADQNMQLFAEAMGLAPEEPQPPSAAAPGGAPDQRPPMPRQAPAQSAGPGSRPAGQDGSRPPMPQGQQGARQASAPQGSMMRRPGAPAQAPAQAAGAAQPGTQATPPAARPAEPAAPAGNGGAFRNLRDRLTQRR